MTETISSLPPARGSHPARSFPGRSDAASNAGAEATPTASMMPVFQRTRLQRATVFAGGLLAAALFASSLTQPWWRFSLYAPQYPRGLTLLLSLSGMTGDVREIDMLNHYIGMGHLSEAASFERAHAVHGVVLLCAACAYLLLQRSLIKADGPDCLLAQAVGGDWKGNLSPLTYAAAIALAFVHPWISCALYIVAAAVWLLPDPRIERKIVPAERRSAADQ